MNEKKMMKFLVVVLALGFFAAPDAIPAPEKRLMIAIGQEPTTMDQSLAAIGGDYTVHDNYAEYLIYRAPNGDLKPGLATAWKISPDGKEIEFTLRKGVKFHSGDAMTLKDIAFSFERGMTKNPTFKTRLSVMERFEAIDDYRFKVYFKTPDVTFIPNRGAVPIISKSYYDRVGEDRFSKNPVGTGPYRFVRHVPGESVDIERFEDYWGEKPSVKEARFLFVSEDATRLAQVKAGEVDITNGCPYPAVRELERSPGIKMIKLAVNHPTASVQFGTRNPNTPWHDKRVRLAMAYAIDCDAIIKNVLNGIPNHWAFLAPYELGYDPDLKPYPYDPKKARELLAEAGYPKGFDLKFYWPITGRIPMSREVSEAVASYFEAVGIRTRLIGEEWAAALSRERAAKTPQAEYVGFYSKGRAGAPDPCYYLDVFFSGTGGFSLYSNPELDKIIGEAKATVNDVKRAELIKKAVRVIHEEAVTIPIYNMVAVYVMKKNIEFTPTQKHPMDLLLVKDITVR